VWWTGSFKDATLLPSALKLQNWVDENGAPQKVVGCTTCHNPHAKGGYPYMLQMSNAASAVCLGCHIK
jgi:predicted CXXCH cytochrome family protein